MINLDSNLFLRRDNSSFTHIASIKSHFEPKILLRTKDRNKLAKTKKKQKI